MKKFLLTLSFLFTTAVVLSAKTVPVPGENITLDLPDSWTVTDAAGMLFHAADPDNVSAIAIKKFPNPSGTGITPSFIDGLKNGMLGQAPKMGGTMTVTSEGSLTMGGAPAYLVQTLLTVPSKKVQMRNYVVATHDTFYLVSLQTLDPAKDADLQAVANSFKFTVPPTPPNNDQNDFDTGERYGRYIGLALPLLVLAVILRIILRKARGSS